MRCACIDIGSNTTRTLVADVVGGRLTEVVCEKAFTELDGVAEIVAAQLAVARSLGTQRLRAVATAGMRSAQDAGGLAASIEARAGIAVDVLTGDEEARLAFAGATHGTDWPGDVAVVDVGGGSTEIAIGSPASGVRWTASVPVGSRSPAGMDRLAELTPPPVQTALAVGGSAASTSRLVGSRIDAASAQAALRALDAGGVRGLEPERVRLLPAGLAILVAVSDLLGLPLTVGYGGLREGVCLELARSAADG